MSVHACTVNSRFEREHVFIGLPKFEGKPDASNLCRTFLNTLATSGGLDAATLAQKLLCVAANGAAVLQGQVNGLIKRVQTTTAPHAIANHCSAHRLQLAAKDFAKDSMVQSVASLCASTYGFFFPSDYRRGLLTTVQIKVGIDELSLLIDIVTRWLSHAAPMRRLIRIYPSLVVIFEEVQEQVVSAAAHANGILHMLTDLDTYLGLLIMEPLMTAMQSTVEKFQKRVLHPRTQ